MIPKTLLPELMTCTPTMEIDYNIMMNQSVTDIDRVKVIMSTIQTLTLNDFHKAKVSSVICYAQGDNSPTCNESSVSPNLTYVPPEPENLSDNTVNTVATVSNLPVTQERCDTVQAGQVVKLQHNLTPQGEETFGNYQHFNELPYYGEDIPSANHISINKISARKKSPYVQLELNGQPTLFLVDSGATDTLLSKQHALELRVLGSSDVEGVNSGTTATGSSITCYGMKRVDLQLGCESLNGPVIIADIHENGILGMDFMATFGCILDFDAMIMRIYDQTIPLVDKKGKRLSCTCFSARQTTIDPHTEMIIDLYANDESIQGGLVQPNYTVMDKLSLLAAPCLTSQDLVLRVANITEHPIHIPKNYSLAYLSNQDTIDIMPERTGGGSTTDYDTRVRLTNSTNNPELPEHVKCLYDSLPSDVSSITKERIKQALIRYQSVFSKDEYDMGYCDLVPHEIHVKPGTQPIRQAPYRTGHHQELEIQKHVTKLQEKGLIEPTVSPWSSPVIVIAKKDGSTRFVQDYRKLNKATYIPSQPLPRIDDCLESLTGSKYFSTFDLLSGYWQCALSPEAKEKVAFCTKGGVYTWKVLGMGLCGAPATFERLMEKVMTGLNWKDLIVYLDDIIVFSSTEDTHVDRLEKMLQRLQQANLKIKPSKTHLMQKKVEFLGHVVDENGIHTDPAKVKAMQEVVSPKCIGDLRTFLGFTGYYRKFISDYADIAAPLYDLLKKKTAGKFNWTSLCENAFLSLKQKLIDFTTLSYPDWTKQFILDSDSSGEAIGAVLAQMDNADNERPIAFYSKRLSESQQKYSVTKQEMLALVSAIRHFHTYLYGAKFLCRVDHHSLIWLNNIKNPQGILARWLETLGSYQFDIEHRPGKQHLNADGLSRFPVNVSTACSEAPGPDDSSFSVQATDVTVGISLAEFAEAQSNDPHLKPIIACVREDKSIDTTDSKQYSRVTRYYLGKLSNLSIKDNLLMIHDNKTNQDRMVVPECYQTRIMQTFHDMDHAGMDRTESRIKLYYFWYALQSNVRTFIQSCSTCQKSKITRNPVNQRNLTVGSLMDQVSLDFVGPLATTSKDNTYILIAIEHFSRWAEAYPLAQPDADSCAHALYNGMFSRFGFSRILHSDKGSAFISQLMKELSKLGNCKQTFSARYHPMGNSYAERVIGSVTSSLRSCVQDTHLEWDELIDTIMMAYRSTPHSSTGFTPNMVMLGREIRLPSVLSPQLESQPVTEHIRNLNEKLKHVYNKCLGHPLSQDESYDHLIHKPYSVDDLVWIKRLKSQLNRPGKLEAKYYGPYPILKVLDYDTYVINENGKEVIEHHARLKRFIPSANSDVIDNPQPEQPMGLDESLQQDIPDNISTGHQPQDTQLADGRGEEPSVARPRRPRRMPRHYDDFVLGDDYM